MVGIATGKSLEVKKVGISQRFTERFESGLQKRADGLAGPRGATRPKVIHERNGKLKQSSFGAAQHYAVTVETDPGQTKVTRDSWEKKPVAGTMLTDLGVSSQGDFLRGALPAQQRD